MVPRLYVAAVCDPAYRLAECFHNAAALVNPRLEWYAASVHGFLGPNSATQPP